MTLGSPTEIATLGRSVKQFVDFLRRKGSASSSPLLAAVEEFIDQHLELLQRLAQ